MVINNMFKKLGLAACVLTATALIGCGDDSNNNGSSCPDGQIKASVGGTEGCYATCMVSTDCGATERCTSGVCVPRTSTPVDMNNSTNNETDMGMTPDQNNSSNNTPDQNNTNNTNNDMGSGDPDVTLCQNYCDKLYRSCVATQCQNVPANLTAALNNAYTTCLNGGTVDGQQLPACITSVKQNAEFKTEIQALVADSCGDVIEENLCGLAADLDTACSCPPPVEPMTLGEPCPTGMECDGGNRAVCLSVQDGGSFCSSQCNGPTSANDNGVYFNANTGCGATNACLNIGLQQGPTPLCLAGCDTTADCPQAATGGADFALSCNFVGYDDVTGLKQGACLPACASDADCGADGACSPSFECVAKCDPASGVQECGPFGTCSANGQCTNNPSCNGANPTCPTGTECIGLAQGATGGVCVNLCETDNECDTGLTCQDIGMGTKVCQP